MTYEQRQAFYVDVLKDVNAVRTEWGMTPLTELPRGTEHHSFRHCAIGEAFELYNRQRRPYGDYGMLGQHIVDRNPLLKLYEDLYEHNMLPEIEPLPVVEGGRTSRNDELEAEIDKRYPVTA